LVRFGKILDERSSVLFEVDIERIPVSFDGVAVIPHSTVLPIERQLT
jgi:hypothetical protein